MSAKNVSKKKYELVAPEGGWGYLICVSFIVNMTVTLAPVTFFGMIYNELIIELKLNSTTVTLISGINAFCVAISAFFTNSLLKLLSRRKLAMIAALFQNVGMVGMIFTKSTISFFIFQGILPGINTGITYNLSCSIINDYFVKKRMFAFSLVQFLTALIAMFAPFFVQWSQAEYGYRGALILLTGVTFHNILAVTLMHPVEWHMKRVEITKGVEVNELESLIMEEKPSVVVVKITDGKTEKTVSSEKINEMDWDCEKSSKLGKFIEAFIDPKFFKEFILTGACIGVAVCSFAETTFAFILPQAFYALGWNQDKVALALSLYGFGDLAMRTVFIFTSKWLGKVGIQELYIFALVLTCVSKLGLIWSQKDIPIFIYLVLMGIARCFICVLVNIVISDVVPPEKFTEAMGIFIMVCGLVVLTLGPAIGAIRDLTNSYSTAFYLLTSCFAIIILFWSIELLYKKNKDKRDAQKETEAKTNQLNKGK